MRESRGTGQALVRAGHLDRYDDEVPHDTAVDLGHEIGELFLAEVAFDVLADLFLGQARAAEKTGEAA